MSLRSIASLAVALFFGLIAVLLVRGYLLSQGDKSASTSTASLTPVVVAALPIERGAGLKPAMLKVVNYPNNAVPAGAFKSIDQVAGSANARTAMRSMSANEPVLNDKLSGAGGKTNLSGTLTPGMRAVSVRSDEVNGVGGFVLPGDRVDILLTRSVGSGDAATTVTQVLAEDSLVLGVDQSSDQEANKPLVAKSVTVEVTPDQAQAISLAHSVGAISLSLRQISDKDALARKATTIADLGVFGRKAAATGARAMAKRPGSEVRVTRGVETIGYSVGR